MTLGSGNDHRSTGATRKARRYDTLDDVQVTTIGCFQVAIRSSLIHSILHAAFRSIVQKPFDEMQMTVIRSQVHSF